MNKPWHVRAEVGLLCNIEIRQGGVGYLIREYDNRLAVSRDDGERMTWEELQTVKSRLWGGGRIAIEVYPADSKVVNLRHTRHLWCGVEIARVVRAKCQHPEFDA